MDSDHNDFPEKEEPLKGPDKFEDIPQPEKGGSPGEAEEAPGLGDMGAMGVNPFLLMGGRQLKIIISTATKEGSYDGRPVPMETITVAFENEGGRFARGEITDFLEIAYIARYIALVEVMWFGDKPNQLPPSLMDEKLRKAMGSMLRARIHEAARTALAEMDSQLRKTGRIGK
jgi:hypothetical protein